MKITQTTTPPISLSVSVYNRLFVVPFFLIAICMYNKHICVLLFLVTILWCCRRWYSGRASSGHQPFQTYSYTILGTKIIFYIYCSMYKFYTNTKLGIIPRKLKLSLFCPKVVQMYL